MTHSPFGNEWIVDAEGCDPQVLRSRAKIESLCAEIIRAVGLTPLGPASWHVFGGEAGITGLQMLSESHLACHTYPEAGYAAFNLYCCRPEPVEWPWTDSLTEVLGATHVSLRVVRRGPCEAGCRAAATDIKVNRAPRALDVVNAIESKGREGA